MGYESRKIEVSEPGNWEYNDEVTTTYGTIKNGQNEAFAEGLLTAANWMNENDLGNEASSMLLALILVKPYEVPNA